MIIATYGPAPETKLENTDPGIRKALYESLGFRIHGEPVWCFYAGDPVSFWVNSLLSIPVCPEILTVSDMDPNYVYAIDKIHWDAYLNSDGALTLPPIKKASLIPPEELYRYELISEDLDYGLLYRVDIRMVKEAFLSGTFDEDFPGLSGLTAQAASDGAVLGKMMHARSGGAKTLEQYVSQSVCFSVRNLYLSTLAFSNYVDALCGGDYPVLQKMLDPNYVRDYYTAAYAGYDGAPDYGLLSDINGGLRENIFYLR
ncbi:MAG: hypothetical protein IJM17_04570 [Firmicutes bacterium]|nr:hypothetical protein [Bacillota bacterium]